MMLSDFGGGWTLPASRTFIDTANTHNVEIKVAIIELVNQVKYTIRVTQGNDLDWEHTGRGVLKDDVLYFTGLHEDTVDKTRFVGTMNIVNGKLTLQGVSVPEGNGGTGGSPATVEGGPSTAGP